MSGEPPTIDGLTVLDRIGRGGFATVWRATDDTFDREVAVKVMSDRLTDEATAMRFQRECRALGAVAGHPNIVTVHQAGTTSEGYPFLVMGYERGGSLAERTVAGALPWAEAVKVGIAMAEALAVAHSAGVLHRDVKPENILIGDFGAPKLTDFGIARLAGGQYTTGGEIMASIAHAPPEVLDGHPPDERADVYSLCSTIHELVGRHPPFFDRRDQSIAPLISRITTKPPPRLPLPAPAALNELLAWGMAKDPAERVQTATELVALLRTVADGGRAGPPGPAASTQAGPPLGPPLPAQSASPAGISPSAPFTPPAPQPRSLKGSPSRASSAGPATVGEIMPTEPGRRAWPMVLGSLVVVGLLWAAVGLVRLPGDPPTPLDGTGEGTSIVETMTTTTGPAGTQVSATTTSGPPEWSPSTTASTEPVVGEIGSGEALDVQAAQDASGLGSLNQPYELGTDVVVSYPTASGDEVRWIVTVVDAMADQTSQLVAEQGVSQPPVGEIFAVARLQITYVSGPELGQIGDLGLSSIGPSLILYQYGNEACPATHKLDPAPLQPGESVEGSFCWQISSGDLAELKLAVEAETQQGAVFLDLA